MAPTISINGIIVDTPTISALSSATLYGKGVFTTIAIRDGKPFIWEKHWMRLLSNSAKLSIELPRQFERDIPAYLGEAILHGGIVSGRARITIFDESPTHIWGGEPGENTTSVLITVADNRSRPENLRLTHSPYILNSTSPLTGVKSCNYLEHLMAYEEARERGFDESIRLNEKGYVTSACMANVFWEAGGRLYSPSLSTGCLAGTTREFVMENFKCEEVEAGIEVLEAANRIFLTSAGLGIVPVAELNGRRLDISEHKILGLWPG